MDLLSTVVFDEISMCIPQYLSYMDFVLRQAREIDDPFGNLAIFITVDFNQLPPVLGDSLYKSAIQCAEYNLNNTRVIDGKFYLGINSSLEIHTNMEWSCFQRHIQCS